MKVRTLIDRFSVVVSILIYVQYRQLVTRMDQLRVIIAEAQAQLDHTL